MTIQEAVFKFLEFQKVKGNTSATIQDYSVKLKIAVDHFGSLFEVSEIDFRRACSYTQYLMNNHLNTITIRSYVRSFRAFLHWLYLNGFHTSDLCSRFVLPKARKSVVNVLSTSEVDKLFSVFPGDTFISLRNRLILALMLDSGLRLREVTLICPCDVNIRDRFILINGKGNKQRFVSFGDFTAKMLALYDLQREPASTYFYKIDKTPLTVNALKDLFRKLKVSSGVERVHAHLLRHTFATRFLQNGGDVYVLKELLGHTSLKQTQGYIHLAKALSIRDYNRYSPLDTIEKNRLDYKDGS